MMHIHIKNAVLEFNLKHRCALTLTIVRLKGFNHYVVDPCAK